MSKVLQSIEYDSNYFLLFKPYSNATFFSCLVTGCIVCYLGYLFPLVLSQVCDCQYQFARWEDGQQRALPCFSSCQGPEFSLSLLEIEGNFHRCLKNVHFLDKDILDVKTILWARQFNQ